MDGEDEQDRQQDRADGVDVPHGVEADAAFEAGSVIAEAGGHPGVGALMHGEREKQDDELIERENQRNAA